MTDHLEPYRRMARSIRFFPPSALTFKPILPPVATESVSVVDSWAMKSTSNAEVKSIEPPIDLSEHAAALVHEAVCKPTVLPATYVIPENIGDRISRLVAASPNDLAKFKPNLPQSTPNGTTAHNGDIASNSDRLVYDPLRQVYALESTIVAEESIAEVETTEAPEAVVEEPIAEVETVVEEPIAEIETVVEEAPSLLEKVSSVIDAVSDAFTNPELVSQENEAEVETASSNPEAIATPIQDNQELLTTEAEVEPAPAPNLLDRVSAVVEVVKTTLKNPEAIASSPETTIEAKTSTAVCPACGSTELRKNGRRKGKQRYACKDCSRQFAIADAQPQAPTSTVAKEQLQKPDTTVEAAINNPQTADKSDAANSPKSGGKKKKAKGFGASKKNS